MPAMKYFTFLFGFFLINFINLIFVPVTLAAVANINQIVFITEPQTVSPGVISKAFTIQTQNSAGSLETIDETSDLKVSVTSATGEFNSNSTSWNPATTFTMSKNTGNKNFYYKDPTAGTYQITATLTTRITSKSWTTSQTVTIGESVVDPIDTGGGSTATSTTATSTTSGGQTVSTSTSSNNGTTVVSTHYITEVVSVYVEPTIFELSAGRDRLGYVGTPLDFKIKYKLSSDLKNKKCEYLWSFGDGSTETGEEVEHIYKYPGNYNLVLNGECSERKAVSRAIIKILAPNISLNKNSDGSFVITNNNKYEINLYNWRLVADKQKYIFPLDTIISAGEKITFPAEYTKILEEGAVSLIDSNDKTVTFYSEITATELIDFIKKINILSP